MTDDNVNHPKHYTQHPSGVECIQITEHFNFNVGNAIKYLWRSSLKGAYLENLHKARWYVSREIERIEKELEAAQVGKLSAQSTVLKSDPQAGRVTGATSPGEQTPSSYLDHRLKMATCNSKTDDCNCQVNTEQNARYREDVTAQMQTGKNYSLTED